MDRRNENKEHNKLHATYKDLNSNSVIDVLIAMFVYVLYLIINNES